MSTDTIPDRDLIRNYFEQLKQHRLKNKPINIKKSSLFNLPSPPKSARLNLSAFIGFLIGLSLVIVFKIFVFLLSFIVKLVLSIFRAAENTKTETKPLVSERLIDQWLKQDWQNFLEQAPTKLKLLPIRSNQNTPLEAQNVLLKTVPIRRGFYLDANDTYWTQNIGHDYYCEKGDDGKTRYSIHRFVVICLCRNFLVIHQYYWNFLKGEPIFIETREYLYDTIVSVRNSKLCLPVEELQRQTYKEFLNITTTDGKEIEFPAVTTRVIDESNSEEDNFTFQQAATIIRQLLRQRRIDVQMTRNVDNDL